MAIGLYIILAIAAIALTLRIGLANDLPNAKEQMYSAVVIFFSGIALAAIGLYFQYPKTYVGIIIIAYAAAVLISTVIITILNLLYIIPKIPDVIKFILPGVIVLSISILLFKDNQLSLSHRFNREFYFFIPLATINLLMGVFWYLRSLLKR